MTTYIALLRGINVGKNNSFPMSELKAICTEAGCKHVRTYIQSGNVLLESELAEAMLVQTLEQPIQAYKQKRIPVMIRSAAEMASVLSRNPFPNALPAQVGVLFFSDPVPKDACNEIKIEGPEEIIVSGREVYIHYPDGMGRSKLKLSKTLEQGTMRNINTVSKLVHLTKSSG